MLTVRHTFIGKPALHKASPDSGADHGTQQRVVIDLQNQIAP